MTALQLPQHHTPPQHDTVAFGRLIGFCWDVEGWVMTFERLFCPMLMPNVIVNDAGGPPSFGGTIH
jgi:hypothetical protein